MKEKPLENDDFKQHELKSWKMNADKKEECRYLKKDCKYQILHIVRIADHILRTTHIGFWSNSNVRRNRSFQKNRQPTILVSAYLEGTLCR